jgi:glycogen(starch) synthase
MRVLFWSELFWPHIGGAEIGGLQLISGLREQGHTITVVTRQDDPSLPARDEHQGIPIFRFPFWKAFADRNPAQLLKARQEVGKLKRGFGPDLVHIHSLGPSSLFYLETATTHEAPLLVTLTREDPETVVGLQLLERILTSANWVTAKSTAALSRARQLVPEIGSRSSVVYRGIPSHVVKTKHLSTLYPTILCVGRLSREKGFDFAIQAFSIIHAHYPEARMIIAGNGPERSSLCGLADSLGLNENVEFPGWVKPENVPTLLSTATVVMVPSRRECLPRVAVEAALLGKPVIATKVGGMAEVVVHGQTGILVEAEAPQALAEATLGLLADPRKAFTMGEAARDRAGEIFDMDRCINAYQSLYEKLALVKSA